MDSKITRKEVALYLKEINYLLGEIKNSNSSSGPGGVIIQDVYVEELLEKARGIIIQLNRPFRDYS